MREGMVFRYIGFVLLSNAFFMAISAIVSAIYGFDEAFFPLILSTFMTAMIGLFPVVFVHKSKERLTPKETYFIVAGAWLATCVVGMFPYILSGQFQVWDAWFEVASGFTTTGATIISDVESLPRGLIFWRATTHWIGGLGIMIFVLTMITGANQTRMTTSGVGLTSLTKNDLRYHTSAIVRVLLLTYIGLTLAETIALCFAGMDWFDSICHSFSTIATGGFSTRNTSIAAFDSLSIEIIISVFTFLSGIHFGLIFATVIGRKNNIFRSEVVRYYFASVMIGAVIIAVSLVDSGMYSDFWSAFRVSSFQSITMITSTGFATVDANTWTYLGIAVLVFLTVQGGCSGSTSGGIKSDRMLLMFKNIGHSIRRQQHPNAVLRLRLNGIAQDERAINAAMFYIVLYFVIVMAGTLIVTAGGNDFMTSLTSSISSMSNAGPAFGQLGTMDAYTAMPIVSKVTLAFIMLLGRLEVFGLIQLFLLKWWV